MWRRLTPPPNPTPDPHAALSELRRGHGARLTTQVGDVAPLSRRGPAALRADLLALTANLNHFRFPCHLAGEKAAGLWPKATLVLDGAEWA